jgi:flagellar biosynthesis/type III secretory pathway chaperone
MGPCGLRVRWPFLRGGYLEVLANFGARLLALEEAAAGRVLYGTDGDTATARTELPQLCARWSII